MRITHETSRPDVLVACADVAYGATVEDFMRHDAGAIQRCHDARGLLRLAGKQPFDIVILDLSLDSEGDVDLVSFVLENNPNSRVILLFEVTMLERALEGIRKGAFFYLPLSSPPTDVALVAGKALRSQRAEAAVTTFERGVFEQFIGHSPAMQRVIEVVKKVAPTGSTVLLQGESGVGKEVMANTVHRLSKRRDQAFIAVNCAALPEALLESELFGHVKGAFTGADRDKTGLFEEADGGTVLLDEIGDMSPITQAKLLRVLQNGEIRRVGSSTPHHVDVRVIAATNVDLAAAVADNRFREDLYFRLNVIQVRIPPLRERMEALPQLTAHFILQSNEKYEKQVRRLDEQAMSLLSHYPFPGNIRELESTIAHAVIMADDDIIRAKDLPEAVLHGGHSLHALPYQADAGAATLAEMEAMHIRTVLAKMDLNQTKAAKALGISRSTLWRKMNEYNIDPKT